MPFPHRVMAPLLALLLPHARGRLLPLSLSLSLLIASRAGMALDFGDAAAPLGPAKWLAGQPLDPKNPAGGKTLLVLFWATWDGSAQKTLATLGRLQEVHAADLTVVAFAEEEEAAVTKFLAERPAACRVALDNGAATMKAWMSGITGLPHAFLVGRDGRVAWHGDPQVGLVAALADLLAGKLDAARYKQLNELHRQLVWAAKAHKVEETFDLLGEMIATVPEDAWAHASRAAILVKQRKLVEARDAYLAMGKACRNDPDALADAAGRLATSSHLHLRDLPAALDFAQRAVAVTASKDPDALDTLARVHYELGHLAKAIEAQALAVKAAPEREQPGLEATLAFYRRERARRAADPDAK